MKKHYAIIALALAVSLTGCRENNADRTLGALNEHNAESFAQQISPEPAESTESEEPVDPAKGEDSEPITPVHIEDIHDWDENNRLYNIDGVYDNVERYESEFETVGGLKVLWSGNHAASSQKYDPNAAAEFAKAHWNDDLDVCAPFVSRCLKAGGLSIGSHSSTLLSMQLLNSGLGFGQFVKVNGDRTVTLPDYAAPGDVVQVYCPYEGTMNHSLLFVGNDEDGNMRVCCHNLANSGKYAFKVDRRCYDCSTPIAQVFFYHFYGENETLPDGIPQDAILFEDSGYVIPNETYDREKAAKYARENPYDGLGQLGAEHLWAALFEGGIKEGYPIQTATFMQLVKSRLGTMYSVDINPDQTITLPKYVQEGDVCLLYCPGEGMIYSSFIIKGADDKGRMLAYSHDKVNDGTMPFLVESVCPSVVCEGNITRAMIYHFD
ncbi:MAG: hypothetical protein HDT42_10210 [Ruminococcaceae bacterium]|nr:hypothetical protein [Oscillospiraceae bacterium]